MATKRNRKAGTNDNQWQPPRGIRYSERPRNPSPFLLHWRTQQGERKAQAFTNAEDREIVAKELAEKRRSLGTAILDVSAADWSTWREFRRLVGNTDPITVAQDWLRLCDAGKAFGTQTTVADAYVKYEALRRAEGKLSDDTWRHIELHVGKRFVGALGSLGLLELEASHIRKWLASLIHPRTSEPMDNLTKRHHRKDVNSFLDRCVREEWATRNPCELVALPSSDDAGDVSVISAEDAKAFFKANAAEPFIVRLALEAFGGVRYSTAGRIGHANIDFVGKGVELPGAIHKSGKRKFRQGHPACLWAWLELAKDAKHPAWAMSLRQYAEAKKLGRIRANVETPHNVWRHSFASYLLAQTKDLARTGYLMQHRHGSTTEIYEGVATEADALVYFGIVPA
jgi:site-specific recombinase XerD